MRLESMVAWRSRAAVAIAIGLVGGIILGGYALFQLAVNGLASHGCRGGGCETQLQDDAAHYESLLRIAIYAGGALVIGGIIAMRVLGKRIKQLRQGTLPVAYDRGL